MNAGGDSFSSNRGCGDGGTRFEFRGYVGERRGVPLRGAVKGVTARRCALRCFLLWRITKKATTAAKTIRAAIIPPTMPPTGVLDVAEADVAATDEEEEGVGASGEIVVEKAGGDEAAGVRLFTVTTMESKLNSAWS